MEQCMTHRPWKDTLTGDTFVQSMLQQSHRDYTDIDIFIRSRIYPREDWSRKYLLQMRFGHELVTQLGVGRYTVSGRSV